MRGRGEKQEKRNSIGPCKRQGCMRPIERIFVRIQYGVIQPNGRPKVLKERSFHPLCLDSSIWGDMAVEIMDE